MVGAGLAGLCAARHLQAAGVDVAVLEQSDGVGGRVRTDVVDGYRLDRGFQVYNTAYPESARMLDHEALQLRAFTPGALVHLRGRRHRVADPRRRPQSVPATLVAPIGSLADKVRAGVIAAGDAVLPEQRLLRRPETTTAAALRARGLSEQMVDRFFRPFLGGVFLETELSTSSRFFDVVLRSFARGTLCVPALGMGAIPQQLAAGLPAGTVRLGSRVRSLTGLGVRVDGAELRARAVVVATAAPAAGRLLPGLAVPPMNRVTTVYHAADTSPTEEPILVLDGENGLVADTIVLSDAAPSYAPPGRALVSSSVVGDDGQDPAGLERLVRRRIADLYGVDTSGWEHVETYHVREALPAMPPPHDFEQPVRVGDGRYVCGDHRDSGSIQGAMVSGRRAAQAVLADLGTRWL